MRLRCLWWMVGIVVVAGCGEGLPPLDELPLRDALRADPDVVAAQPDGARTTLAARLEAARASDGVIDTFGDAAGEPAALVAALDLARSRRSGDPLIAGVLAGGVATPVVEQAEATGGPALPPLEGGAGAATADLELAALNGAAGASVRALLRTSGAGRLVRVTGWPTGAVAVGDTVYVNAAWLVALAPGDRNPADGGVAPAPVGGPAPPPLPARVQPPEATGRPQASEADAGAPAEQQAALAADYGSPPDGGTTTTEPPPPPPTGTSFGDACGAGAGACASTDDSSCDDSSDDSCDSTTDDGSTDSCNNTTDDGSTDACNSVDDGGDSSCQMSRGRTRGRGRGGGGGPGTVAWLLTPLGYLMARERPSPARRRR